jgi:hypothetical protein
MRIIQQHVLPIFDVAKLKAPILVERNSLSRTRIREGKGSHKKHKTNSDARFSAHKF